QVIVPTSQRSKTIVTGVIILALARALSPPGKPIIPAPPGITRLPFLPKEQGIITIYTGKKSEIRTIPDQRPASLAITPLRSLQKGLTRWRLQATSPGSSLIVKEPRTKCSPSTNEAIEPGAQWSQHLPDVRMYKGMQPMLRI